jgi:adenine-specific DNA-methyltransferase
VYNDDFVQNTGDYMDNSGQYDEQGNRLVQNSESNGRFHTDWLNMIYPRLKLAKDLLTDDGVIFISIDENEVENLGKLCDEVFGSSNRQAIISYVRKTSGKQDSTNFMKSTEFIFVYSKTESWDCSPIIATERVTERYNKTDNTGRAFRETDLRKTGNADRKEDRPQMWYPFYYNPSTFELCVRQEPDNDLISKGFVEIYPIKPDESEGRWRWGYNTACENIENLVARIMPKYKASEKYTVYEIDYIDKNGDIRTVKEHTSWDRKEFNSDNAILEFKKLGFSNQLFPFPKSSALIKHMTYLANCENSIVLDFFSGSATTAHAVMQLNAEDGGHRKFIMVQLPEKTDEKSEAYKAGYQNICEIGKERIRRAGAKIKEENGLTAQGLDVGFRVLKLDSSNMKDVYYNPADFEPSLFDSVADNIKEDRTPEDLLFQVMLDLGVLLSSKIEETTIAGKRVFNVADGFLIACFDNNVTDDAVKAIAQKKPHYAIFRDSSMATDSVATNFDQIFAAYSPETIRKVL